jgi:hypothetical protein
MAIQGGMTVFLVLIVFLTLSSWCVFMYVEGIFIPVHDIQMQEWKGRPVFA